jgi:hypothetical protein
MVLYLTAVKSQTLADAGMGPDIKTGVNHFSDVLGLEVILLHQPGDSFRDELTVTLVPDPSVLPGTIELVLVRPPVVREVIRERISALNAGDDILVTQQQSGGTITVDFLLIATGLPQTAIGGTNQDFLG